jgi:hypothetical protein
LPGLTDPAIPLPLKLTFTRQYIFVRGFDFSPSPPAFGGEREFYRILNQLLAIILFVGNA